MTTDFPANWYHDPTHRSGLRPTGRCMDFRRLATPAHPDCADALCAACLAALAAEGREDTA